MPDHPSWMQVSNRATMLGLKGRCEVPSPFPGMDPDIETRRIWPDFHHGLADEIRATLNAQIQPRYYATTVTYVTYDVIEIVQPEPRVVSPDVSVWHTAPGSPTWLEQLLLSATAQENQR